MRVSRSGRFFPSLCVLVVVILTGLGSSCDSTTPKPVDPADTASRTEMKTAGGGPELPSAFSLTRFADFDKAGEAVGFDIPRSANYTLVWGHLFVQPGIELGPDIVRKVTAIYRVNGFTVYVTCAPRTFWPEGALEGGEQVRLGGYEGHLIEGGQFGLVFSSHLSDSSSFGPVWMEVETSPEALPSLEAFLSDLQLPT